MLRLIFALLVVSNCLLAASYVDAQEVNDSSEGVSSTCECGPNEQYVDCTSNRCVPQTCSELGTRVPCPYAPNQCNTGPGCVCEDGYLRNIEGVCVPENECPKSDTPNEPCSATSLETLLKGSAEFSGKFESESYRSEPTKSQVMSPLSVFIPMGILANQAENNTYTQLINALNLQTKNDIRCAFPALTRELTGDSSVTLESANIIYAPAQYPLKQRFRDDTKNVFNADFENLDMTNKQAAANQINQWVEDHTNKRIKNLAKPSMFDESTRLILVNALYFLGNWQYQFNANKTVDRDFYIDSKNTIKIPTMYQQNRFKYGEISSLDCKALEMSYKGGNFSFFVLLPNQIDGLAALIEKLRSSNEFYGAYDNTSYQKVNVYLPKIKTESEFNLKTIMIKLGITDIFDRRRSSLDGILEQYEPLYVTAAIQKSFIEVTETGTEAAAANIFTINTLSASIDPPQIFTFKTDRPFVYFIMRKRTVLFSGIKVD